MWNQLKNLIFKNLVGLCVGISCDKISYVYDVPCWDSGPIQVAVFPQTSETEFNSECSIFFCGFQVSLP